MIDEGVSVPRFELPAVIEGEIGELSLAEYLGEDIVILAFYPGDFNPGGEAEATDLDELDLFTMQKDVSILGISADSVYSHRAFAEEYDLHVPLLADVTGEVARAYGVATDGEAGYLTERAVIVVDPDGEVEFAWRADGLSELPPVEEIRSVVDGIGGDDAAEGRYRVGHAHYIEGRRAFTSAMSAFDEHEWMLAQGDFNQARAEFEEAADQFDTAARFGEQEDALTYYDRAERKAEALWQASEWLASSAGAFASGEGAEGESMRKDAEAPLETARGIHEPPDPDDFPPEEDPAGQDDPDRSILPTDDDEEAPSLDIDLEDSPDDAEAPTDDGFASADEAGEAEASDDESEDTDDGIDDDELEEITAELEEQTQQAQEQYEAEQAAEAEGDGDGSADGATEPLADDSFGDAPTADPTVDGEPADPGRSGTTGDPDGESPAASWHGGPDDGSGDTGEDATATTPAGGGGTGLSDDQADGRTDGDGADGSDRADGADGADDADDADIELDLTDPVEEGLVEADEDGDDDGDEDEETADEDPGSGDHGVPDSL